MILRILAHYFRKSLMETRNRFLYPRIGWRTCGKITQLDAVPRVIQIRLTMKSATIRDLRNSFPIAAQRIQEGECVEITHSGKSFARMRKHFPNEKSGKGLPSLVDYDRGDQ